MGRIKFRPSLVVVVSILQRRDSRLRIAPARQLRHRFSSSLIVNWHDPISISKDRIRNIFLSSFLSYKIPFKYSNLNVFHPRSSSKEKKKKKRISLVFSCRSKQKIQLVARFLETTLDPSDSRGDRERGGGGRGREIGRSIRKNRLGTLYLSRGGTCRRGSHSGLSNSSSTRLRREEEEEEEVIKRRNCHVAELMSSRGGRRRIY